MTKRIEHQLTNRNIKPTAMRLLVLKAMLEQPTAISLSELEKKFEHADRVTLYRTLKTFQDNGLVHSIDDGTGALKYALCEEDCECDIQKDLHLHFHCHLCGNTFCLQKYKIPEITLPAGFAGEEANLVVKGICKACR